MLFQALNLNLLYTDGLWEIFDFSRQEAYQKEKGLKLYTEIVCPNISINILDFENDLLINIQTKDIKISNSVYWESHKLTQMTAQEICIYDRDPFNSKQKIPLLYPKKKKQAPQINSCSFDMTIDISLVKSITEITYLIKISEQQLILRINSLYLILHFLSTSLPDYELLPDKPNQCNNFINFLDYDYICHILFKFNLEKSVLLIFGDNNLTALALEGGFDISFSKKGFEDIVDGHFVYTGLSNAPEKKQEYILSNMSAFICSWNDNKDTYFSLSDCKKRLIIEPVKEIRYLDVQNAEVDNVTCKIYASKAISLENLPISLTYFDFAFLLNILQYSLKQMSLDYFVKLRRYYEKLIGSKHIKMDQVEIFEYASKSSMKIADLLTQLSKMSNYYGKESTKIETLRQDFATQIHSKVFVKSLDISNQVLPQVYKRCQIDSETKAFSLTVAEGINLLIINFYYGVFCPLFFIKISSPFFQSTSKDLFSGRQTMRSNLEINYYNREVSSWEPFIEDCSFDLFRTITKDEDELDFHFQNKIDINISDTLISLLKDCWKSWNSDISEKDIKRNRLIHLKEYSSSEKESLINDSYDTISEFAIENFTEETIFISFKNYPKHIMETILPCETVNICRDPTDAIRDCKAMSEQTFNIGISFKSPIHPIDNLNLLITSNKTIKINEMCEDKRIKLLLNVKQKDSRKILTFSTPTQLENRLAFQINVTFQNPSNTTFNLEANTGCMCIQESLLETPITFSIKGQKPKALKNTMTFYDLFKILKNQSMGQIWISETEYALLVFNFDESKDTRKYLIVPPICIYNCLPITLMGVFKGSNQNFNVDSKRYAYIYTQSVAKPAIIKLTIPSFVETDFEIDFTTKVKQTH